MRDDNSVSINAIFVNSYTGAGASAGSWHLLDVTTLGIPITAKAVFLVGILIITHGITDVLCDLSLALRAYGDPLNPGNYIGQTIERWVGGGQRSTMSSWVPVKQGKFEYYWSRSTFDQWPTSCAYGINLSAQAYID